ncbi:hypothetical protein GCM10017600_57910 [Streptosporangium carneum]|uniref:KAP NTPase domain-containing protein n=2 Tax=Streptosporangium carneum TaxID=47481 RepID=A0A9W6I6M7_9ACTN|nr:hypothetical protein GCM10017600_57910 [Streptosporangium carneum]
MLKIQEWWSYHRFAIQIAAIITALIIWPSVGKLRALLGSFDPPLVLKAREYLLRLQMERTATWAFTGGLSFPFGITGSGSRGSSLKYLPWTLPELVSSLREFIGKVAVEQRSYGKHVIIAIDEIDRIGSAEKAERFISEIKSIFGIDNCFFLVSVAEDVGSIFGHRALAGKSVFDTAFDEVKVIDQLSLRESKDLLQQRVLGFTDPFVSLVHSVSGGLPRELLRSTRRMLDINQELNTVTRKAPRREDLAITLICEEMREIIAGARDYISRVDGASAYGYAIDLMRMSLVTINSKPLLSIQEALEVLDGLTTVIDIVDMERNSAEEGVGRNEKIDHILHQLSVYAYFGLTVIEMFSDDKFDIGMTSDAKPNGLLPSFDELAAVRRELSISSESCRLALERFRNKWGLG